MWQLCPDHAAASSKGGPGREGGEEEEWLRLDHPKPRHQRREARPRHHEQDDNKPSSRPRDEMEEEILLHLSVEAPVCVMVSLFVKVILSRL